MGRVADGLKTVERDIAGYRWFETYVSLVCPALCNCQSISRVVGTKIDAVGSIAIDLDEK